MDKICGIYCIENMVDGKKYIGQSINIYKRWKSHIYDLKKDGGAASPYLQNAWNKYGEDNFKFYILICCFDDKKILNKLESFYIKYFNTFIASNGYNLDTGGKEDRKISDVTKEKMRNSKLGKKTPSFFRKLYRRTKRKLGKIS